MIRTYSLHQLEQAIAHNVIIVSADESIHEVVQLFNQREKSVGEKIACVLVMAASQLVGIVTPSDLIRFMFTDSDLSMIKMADVMTKPVVTLPLEQFRDVITPLNLLRHNDISYLPVLDHHDYPIGLITLKGLLQLDALQSEEQNHDQQVEHEWLLTAISNRIQSSLDLQIILDTTVTEIRQFLQTDRVIAYRFEPDWSGIVVAESVASEWNSLLGKTISDPHFIEHMVEPYQNGRIQVTNDVALGELTGCHMIFLQEIQVKAIVVVPILNGDKLWGLLAAQECAQPRYWQPSAIDLLQQLATHIGIAIQQASTIAQINHLNHELEGRVSERTAALATSEKNLNLIVSNIFDGVLILDLEGKIMFANPSAERIFGIPIKQLIGLMVGIPINKQFEINHLINYREIGGSEVDFVLIEWDNQPAYLISLHDITERQRAEQKLQIVNQELARATRLKDEFLANMSHELRTPLNAILGMTEGLQEGFLGAINPKQAKSLQTIERSGTHLLSLINDILDVAKIESGQVILDIAPTSINNLCQSSLSFIKQQAMQKRIQLEVDIPLYLPDILVDERRIRQVLINLLNNSLKFTPEGGCITLQVSPSENGDYLKIAVIDTGIGIAAENIKKLFQPFIQIDSALNRQYEGTGLGLALVKRLVELHGGSVGLTSELGVGSCFTIDLPYSSCPNEMRAEVFTSEDVTSNLQPTVVKELISAPLILVAEDNEANILTISSYLIARGYRLKFAKDGQEAIALAKTLQPDLILMDIQMPVMDGLEATKQIRLDPKLANIPIIALTALAMTGDRERCLEAGVNDYLAKPFKLKQLAEIIQKLLINKEG